MVFVSSSSSSKSSVRGFRRYELKAVKIGWFGDDGSGIKDQREGGIETRGQGRDGCIWKEVRWVIRKVLIEWEGICWRRFRPTILNDGLVWIEGGARGRGSPLFVRRGRRRRRR